MKTLVMCVSSAYIGHLEKLISMPIADLASVNMYESEREQSRIIWRQFCGTRPVEAIFRGALMSFAVSVGRFSFHKNRSQNAHTARSARADTQFYPYFRR